MRTLLAVGLLAVLPGCQVLDMIVPPPPKPAASQAQGQVQIIDGAPEEVQEAMEELDSPQFAAEVAAEAVVPGGGAWVEENLAVVQGEEGTIILVVLGGDRDLQKRVCDLAVDKWLKRRWALGPVTRYHLARPCQLVYDDVTPVAEVEEHGTVPADAATGAATDGAPAEPPAEAPAAP